MESLTIVLEKKAAQAVAHHETQGIIPGAVHLNRPRASGIKPVLLNIFPYFELTFIATHIWTVIIAFHYGGLLIGFASLVLAGPAEVYWIIRLFDDHPIYAASALLHLLLVVPMKMARKGIPY